ncbi:hypothetical protein JTE90_009783 [Oedothorax gibbosus]|uniref:Uncharacterized protein n=1 Tax=Oedothorax gibbosus TaxID=931172 RepID=A0AAV6VA84_9ARAC|nr:hypothetical protein JTE90_009783 [Oedothorax gibbosus]
MNLICSVVAPTILHASVSLTPSMDSIIAASPSSETSGEVVMREWDCHRQDPPSGGREEMNGLRGLVSCPSEVEKKQPLYIVIAMSGEVVMRESKWDCQRQDPPPGGSEEVEMDGLKGLVS